MKARMFGWQKIVVRFVGVSTKYIAFSIHLLSAGLLIDQ